MIVYKSTHPNEPDTYWAMQYRGDLNALRDFLDECMVPSIHMTRLSSGWFINNCSLIIGDYVAVSVKDRSVRILSPGHFSQVFRQYEVADVYAVRQYLAECLKAKMGDRNWLKHFSVEDASSVDIHINLEFNDVIIR